MTPRPRDIPIARPCVGEEGGICTADAIKHSRIEI